MFFMGTQGPQRQKKQEKSVGEASVLHYFLSLSGPSGAGGLGLRAGGAGAGGLGGFGLGGWSWTLASCWGAVDS